MPEETTVTTEETTTVETEDNRVPYERFEKVNKKAKEAADKAAAAERRAQELAQQLEEREAAGMPELDQLRKRLEQAEKRAQEAEKLAEDRDRQVAMSRAERFVIAAAKDFVDADDAVRNVDLAEIESQEDAERAVKRVAKVKPHLLKQEDRPLPGKVLDGGRAPAATTSPGGIDQEQEARTIYEGLKQFTANWHTVD